MANTDYGAIPLTLATATSQALNHRLGVSTGFKPSEWAENINLLVKPAEKSASGSVAHFTDGLDMPLVSLSCDVTAWQEGSGTASPSNPRAIHGWSEANVTRTGKNLLNGVKAKDYALATFNTSTSGENTTGKYYTLLSGYPINDINLFPWLKFKSNTAYTFIVKFAKNNTAYSTNIQFVYSDGTFDSIVRVGASDVVTESEIIVATSNSSKTLVGICGRFQSGTSYLYYDHMGVFEGTVTDNSYEPYKGEVKNIPFGQTVYGGRLNVMTGELTIDKGYLQSTAIGSVGESGGIYYWVLTNGLDSVNDTSTIISSHFKAGWQVAEGNCYITGNGKILVAVPSDQTLNTKELADAWCATNKPQFVYSLATPTTITLTPHQMSSLLGENNIWADCGDSAVVYRGMVGDSFKCFFNSQVTSGWAGTSVERTMLTVTGNGNGSITFDNKGKGRTNCSNSDGYISVKKNGTAVYTKSLAPNTDETLAIPVVNFSAGDVITLVFGFANYHSNINMKLTGDTFTVQGSATVSGISNTTNTSTTLEVST